MRTIEELKLELSNPSEAYRSAPFWAWNDRLEEGELARQIDGMQEQGMGGFFIHSREGLETEYLSEEWMQAVGTAVKRAAGQRMEAWIYDEDKCIRPRQSAWKYLMRGICRNTRYGWEMPVRMVR